jgi:hypothetical protein
MPRRRQPKKTQARRRFIPKVDLRRRLRVAAARLLKKKRGRK